MKKITQNAKNAVMFIPLSDEPELFEKYSAPYLHLCNLTYRGVTFAAYYDKDSFDCWTIVYPDGDMVGLSTMPFHPLGFCQYVGTLPCNEKNEVLKDAKHLGVKQKYLTELNDDCLKAIYMRGCWQVIGFAACDAGYSSIEDYKKYLEELQNLANSDERWIRIHGATVKPVRVGTSWCWVITDYYDVGGGYLDEEGEECTIEDIVLSTQEKSIEALYKQVEIVNFEGIENTPFFTLP